MTFQSFLNFGSFIIIFVKCKNYNENDDYFYYLILNIMKMNKNTKFCSVLYTGNKNKIK